MLRDTVKQMFTQHNCSPIAYVGLLHIYTCIGACRRKGASVRISFGAKGSRNQIEKGVVKAFETE